MGGRLPTPHGPNESSPTKGPLLNGHHSAASSPKQQAAAIDLAEQGVAVLPCHPGGKAPLGRLVHNGVKDSTSDVSTVARWWSDEPRANIGMATGVVNGVAVVDVDFDAGADEGDFPPSWNKTRVVRTPHGVHLYYAVDAPQRCYREVAGIGLKADGGYVIVPPSVTDHVYELYKGCPPISLPTEWMARFSPPKVLETLPHPVRERVERRGLVGGKVVHIRSSVLGYVHAALRNECGYVLAAPVGERNNELNVAAFALGQLVDTGWLPEGLVYVRLSDAARRVGLDEREARATIRSGINAGSCVPRTFA